MDTNGQKRWDDSLLTKEEARAVVMSKKEAALRRERIKEYAVTHRVFYLIQLVVGFDCVTSFIIT